MKKYIISVFALLAVCSVEMSAQNLLNRIGKAIEKEVEKEVGKEVQKRINQFKKDVNKQEQQAAEAAPAAEQTPEQAPAAGQAAASVPVKKNKAIVPVVIEEQTNDAPVSGSMNGYEWVDLGLPSGTLWASCNVGASKPSQSGSLYAWGETSTKSSYTQENSAFYGKETSDFSADKSKDVAAAKWGEGWRMPTREEFDELLFYCNWKYVQRDGRWGSELSSTINNQSIFLPVTGYKDGSKHEDASGNGMYWTSTPQDNQWNNGCHVYQFGGALGEMSASERSYGLAVRPVADNKSMIDIPSQGETDGYQWVDLGLPSGRKWATRNVGAATSEHLGDFFAWAEVTPVLDKESKKNKTRGKWMSGIGGSTSYDAAAANWGEAWKMPTKADFQELMENCTWEWTSLGRVKGCKATSKINGNYIFFPAAGIMHPNSSYAYPDDRAKSACYWASTPSEDQHYLNADAFMMIKNYINTAVKDRREGYPIRPVLK